MPRLIQWLDHRMEVVGLDRLKELAEWSGVSLHTLRELRACQTLDTLSRSERRMLAAALRVSLRKLEQLGHGDIDWIDDQYVYDVSLSGQPFPLQEREGACWTPTPIMLEERGTPLVGRVRPAGEAEPDEDWQEEWGRRIPRRFGKGRDIYALEFEGRDQSIVLRNIAPWEFRAGQAAIYCWNGWEAQGWFGRVYLQPSSARVITPDGQRHDLDVLNVVRIGKVVGRWPGDAQ